MNVWRKFPLAGELLQNRVKSFHEFEKPGDQHHQFPVITNATPLKQKQGTKLRILGQEIENHFYHDLELIELRRDAFCSQTNSGIELLPSVSKDRFQNALFAAEVFDQLGFARASQAANGSRRSSFVAALSKQGFRGFQKPLTAS